jgi:starvation-inducible outer membrane lipoprotein
VIEAEYIPVDAEGRLQDSEEVSGRFMAFLPRAQGTLSPEVYSKGEKITIAGEFMEMEPRTRGDVDYIHPRFEIKDIHLWKKAPISYAPLPPTETSQDPTLLSDPFWRDRSRPSGP